MIKMYVMHTCPDCEYVEKQVEGNPDFAIPGSQGFPSCVR